MDVTTVIAALVGAVVTAAAFGLPKLVAKTENKVDDAAVELLLKALQDPEHQKAIVDFIKARLGK